MIDFGHETYLSSVVHGLTLLYTPVNISPCNTLISTELVDLVNKTATNLIRFL